MNLKNKIYVENGDIPTGLWELQDSGKRIQLDNDRIYIALNKHLIALEVVNEKNDRTLTGTGSAALVGGLVLGPLGAIAGAIYGGKRDAEVVVIGVLSDQRKFVAKIDKDDLPKLKLIITNSPVSGDSIEKFSQEDNKNYNEKLAKEGKDHAYSILVVIVLFILIGMLSSC